MDSKKVLSNPLKNAAKNDEARQTQVFVLPPELLKGLLLQNKIPKINDPKNLVSITTTSTPANVEKEEKKVEQLPNSLAKIVNETNKTEKKNRETVKELVQNSSANKAKEIEAKTPVNKKKNQKSTKKIEESAIDVDLTKQIKSPDKSKSIQENVESAKKTSGRRRRITKISKPSKVAKNSNEKQNIVSQNHNKEHVVSNNLSVENNTEIIPKVVNDNSLEKLVCLDSVKSSEIENDAIQNNILSSHSKEEKKEENIDKTCMQNENPNLEITDKFSTRRSSRRISKNSRADEIANVSEEKPNVIEKQEIDGSSKNESLLENNVMVISNESDVITSNAIQSNLETFNELLNTTELNLTSSSGQKSITEIAKPCELDNTSNVDPKTVNKVEVNADDLSTESCIKPINEGNNLEFELEKEQMNKSVNTVNESQTRLSRRKRISRIPNLSGILKTSTQTQELDDQEKDDVNTISLLAANCSESHMEITDTSLSENLTCLKFNKPSEVVHRTVHIDETITTNSIIEKEKVDTDSTCVETEQSSLEIKDKFLKSTDVNQTRYSRRKSISKIPEPKKVVDALNDKSKTDTKSLNKDMSLLANESPQKNCSKTIIEKYKKLCIEKIVDANSTLEADSDKTNFLQSFTDIGNLNLSMFDESSINENQKRYSRRRRISKVPNLIKVDKVSNDKSKTTDQSKKETNINDILVENGVEPQTEETTITSSKEIVPVENGVEPQTEETTITSSKEIVPVENGVEPQTEETTITSSKEIVSVENGIEPQTEETTITSSKEIVPVENVIEPQTEESTITSSKEIVPVENVIEPQTEETTIASSKEIVPVENVIEPQTEETTIASSKEIVPVENVIEPQTEETTITSSKEVVPVENVIEPQTEETTITSSKEIVCSNKSEEATNKIIEDTSSIEQLEVNLDQSKIPNALSELEVVEPIRHSSRISQVSNLDKSKDVFKHEDKQETVFTSDESNKVCALKIQDESSHLTESQSRYSRRKRVARIPSIITNSTKIKQSASNSTENEAQIIIKNLPTKNDIDTKMVEKPSLENMTFLDSNKYSKVNRNIAQSIAVLSSEPNFQAECAKTDKTSSKTDITINDQSTEIDTEMVEKSSLENMAFLDSNEFGDVDSNIAQSIASSDSNFQTDCAKTDVTSLKTDITINDQSTKICIETEMVEKPSLKNMAFLDSNESGDVDSNIVQSIASSDSNFQTDIAINGLPSENCIQSIGVLSSDLNITKECTKSDTNSEKIEESNLETSNKSLNASNEELITASDELTNTFDTLDKNIIVEQVLERKKTNATNAEISNDENLSILLSSVEHEKCQEYLEFENDDEEIEIIEEIEYIIEEILEEEYTEASDNIIVYDTMDSIGCEVEKSPIKNKPFVEYCVNDQVANLSNSNDTELNDINENVLNEEESPIKNLPLATSCKNNQLTSSKHFIDSELNDNNKNILNINKESPIKNMPSVGSSENNQVASPNKSIDLELNDSNEIALVKKENEKVNVYVNKRKIQSKTYSNENHTKSEDSSIEVKNTTHVTDLPTHDAPLPIPATRRYSARACKKNSILNSTTAQREQKKEPKGRNRSKSTNQVNNNKSDVINTRTRSVSVTINSSSLKQCKNEDVKITKESLNPPKAFKRGKKRKNLIKSTQALVEDDAIESTKDKRRRPIQMIEQKTEENRIVENQKEIPYNDATNVSSENHKGKLCINFAGSNVITNEAEINLSCVNDEEDVTIDIKEILDSLAIDDSQDEDDPLLFFRNTKIIEDEETKSVEENFNKVNHIETICEYNFNISTNKVHTENAQMKESNESHNDKREKVTLGKANLKNDITITLKKEKLLANDSVEDEKTENMFTDVNASEIDSSTMQNAKQTNVNGTSEGSKNEMIIGQFHDKEETKGIFEAVENPKLINLEFNGNVHKFTDDTKLSVHIASIHDPKDKLDNLDVSEISESNSCPKSNENIKIETDCKSITEQNLDASKESDIDSVGDNYESANIPFDNYDCSSISSTDDLNESTNKEILAVKNPSDLDKLNESQNEIEDNELFLKRKIEKSQKSTVNGDEPNEAINNNVQTERLGMVLHTFNIQDKNLGIKDLKVVEPTSLWTTNNKSPRSTDNNNADSQSKSIASTENVSLSRENSKFGKEKDIKRTLKQTSLDSFIFKKTKESTFKLSSTTERISEKISKTSNDLNLERDISVGQIESSNQSSKTEIQVFGDDSNLNEVSEHMIAFTEEANIEPDNCGNKNQENLAQINISTACIAESAKTTNNSNLESDNNKIISEKLDKVVVSVDKVEDKNNLLLESDSAIDNPMIVSEKLITVTESNMDIAEIEDKNNLLLESDSAIDNPMIVSEKLITVTESNMDIAEIEDKNKDIKDMPTITPPVSTQKKRRGRPPKSAKKIVKKIPAAEDIPNTENSLRKKVDNIDDEEKTLEIKGRKRRSCRLSLLEEPRRSTRHKTDDSLKEVLNSSIKQRRPNRRSTKEEVESQISEENADISVNNSKDQNINKLSSENTEHQVKKRKGRPPKSKLEKTSIFNDQETPTLMKNKDDGDSSITLKTLEQQSQNTCSVLNTEGIFNEIDAKSTDCDATAETNINDSTVLTENDATDTVATDTRKRKRSAIKVIAQEDHEIESEKDSMADLNTTTVEKELSDGSNSDADEIVVQPAKRRKGPLGPYRKRRRGKKRRGRPPGVQRKSVCDNDYVPHHSHLIRTPKKETAKIDSFAELSMKKIIICGKCDAEMAKNQWAHHNLMTHNNTGWLKGSAKPDFENDEKLYKKVINLAHKKRKKTLVCEQCKVVKRSVAGYLSHLTFCGKSEEEMQALMVTCPICHAVTKPSSVEYHERMHRMEAEAKERMPEIDMENVDFGPRGKRKAAEKAVNKISEFTALVKDDKENSGPFDKKLKINSNMKKVIQKPQLEKRIPSTSINKWRKDLASGQNATCSQIGCQFTSNSFDEIKSHYSACNFTPRENYVCKICRFQSSTEKEILEHASEKHSLDDEDANLSLSDAESSSSDNSSDNEDTIVNRSQPQAVMRKFYYKESAELSNKLFKFIFKDGACHTKFSKTYFGAFQWTLEFERKNYKFRLFEEYAPNEFKLLNSRESCSYLPEVEQSMPMMIIKSGNKNEIQPEWKTWKRFEGQCCEDNPTFFVGGPVWALAWLPIPTSMSLSEDLSQFIAVSTHPTMDATYSVGESYSGKNIIQIWDVGNLNHKSISQYSPKLAYAITHEGGTVWCLEWCPSGCYQHKDLPGYIENNAPNKMGLLAAGCSDGCVRIYSLVFPENLAKENSENVKNIDEYPVYNTEPVLVLVINKSIYDDKKQNWQVTKLSWSKEKDHNIIAAGFSNGYVALWNLALKSPLLKSKKDNTVYLHPYRHFFAHHHAISMVHLIPQDNKRFLATASLDRLYKLWDLEDVTNPKNLFKKSFVTDGAWLNHWCTAFVTYDDALSMGHNYSYCLPLRDYTYKYFNIFPTNSPSFSISTSDYGNSIANGTLAGEILAIFPQQLIYIRDMEKTLPRKRYISMISTSELVDFQKVKEANNVSKDKEKDKVSTNNKKDKKDDKTPYDFMPTTYKDSKDRFGIKFYDKLNVFRDQSMIKPKNQKKTLTIEMMEKTPVEQYPFMSVNRLSWNPNASSFLWLAAGYHNGFVRLMSFKSMASPAEWSKLLTSHIETLKSQCAESQSTKLDDR